MPSEFQQSDINIFDDDEEGWMDMPIIKDDLEASGFDEEDAKKYHYRTPAKASEAGNATGDLLDVDSRGNEWRSKRDQDENDYTRLRMKEEDDADEVHLRTRYLFDEDKAMTPISQMQTTKNLLTDAQRIAYVGVCALTIREMMESLKAINTKEIKPAVQNMELWALKILGRLYYHMELETAEQKMIESLGIHGVQANDLVPSLMTTHTVANPEYDPAEARRQAEIREEERLRSVNNSDEDDDVSVDVVSGEDKPSGSPVPPRLQQPHQTTTRVLENPTVAQMTGVTTTLSAADENVTLDIRWTVLCDLFLLLIADSVYDARSRVLLEHVAVKLGLGWVDVVRFEQRVTEALEIQEDAEKMESQEIVDGRQKINQRRRYVMLGLATLGGGLVIGLSAGLLAPVIGAGLGAAFTTIGIGGTTGFLAGAGGAAIITTSGVLTGSGIAARGMSNRTQNVRTFQLLPLHNHRRVNCIVTVPGFMNSLQDDVRLPFSVLDPVVGDVFSVLWEPEMIKETGAALKILTTEVLTQIGQTVLQATVMTALMSALQWPIVLTKLGYLIDNPWSNALDRAKTTGGILADILIQRHLGVRPVTLIGFSLGARVIFYALLELAKKKAFGIVQDVFILGTTVTASTKTWIQARSVVSGRFVSGYCRNDWVLNYLFRATGGGLHTVAGLRPVKNVPGLENVDVTDKISGHMSYRTFMPLILDALGFPVTAVHFDDPDIPDFKEDRIVVRDGETPKKKSWFFGKSPQSSSDGKVSRPPSAMPLSPQRTASADADSAGDDDLPSREELIPPSHPSDSSTAESTSEDKQDTDTNESTPVIPLRAGFDLDAMKEVIRTLEAENNPSHSHIVPPENSETVIPAQLPARRSGSAPPVVVQPSLHATPKPRPSNLHIEDEAESASTSSTFAPLASRSLSMSNVKRSDEGLSPSPVTPPRSFERFTASAWPPSSDEISKTTQSSQNNERNPYFGSYRSKEVLSFGDATGSLTSFSPNKPPPPSLPLTINPFASSTSLFGDSDQVPGDSLETNASIRENYAWKMTPDSLKLPTSASSHNPWS